MVQAPTRDPSNFGIAQSAEPALFMPEKAKRTSTPKRFLHMGSFALFEVGFIGRVVGVRVTFDFNVSLDGCATGVAQPNLAWLPLVIALFTEEGPVTTTTQRKVLLWLLKNSTFLKTAEIWGIENVYANQESRL